MWNVTSGSCSTKATGCVLVQAAQRGWRNRQGCECLRGDPCMWAACHKGACYLPGAVGAWMVVMAGRATGNQMQQCVCLHTTAAPCAAADLPGAAAALCVLLQCEPAPAAAAAAGSWCAWPRHAPWRLHARVKSHEASRLRAHRRGIAVTSHPSLYDADVSLQQQCSSKAGFSILQQAQQQRQLPNSRRRKQAAVASDSTGKLCRGRQVTLSPVWVAAGSGSEQVWRACFCVLCVCVPATVLDTPYISCMLCVTHCCLC